MKNFERMMNFFTGRGAFILITTVILLVVAIMHCSSWSDVQEFVPFALAAEFFADEIRRIFPEICRGFFLLYS